MDEEEAPNVNDDPGLHRGNSTVAVIIEAHGAGPLPPAFVGHGPLVIFGPFSTFSLRQKYRMTHFY